MTASPSPFDAMPRPVHHPVLGHLPEWLGKGNAQKVLHTLLDYGRDVGPVARIPLGPARLVLVSDPEPIRELLTAEDANVKGWPYILTRVVLDNVLLLNGEAWAVHRALYRKALRAADPMSAVDAALRARVGELVGPVDLQRWVRDLAADCVMQLLCGRRWDPALEPHRERVQYELAAVGIDLQCQPWAYFSPARWTAMRRSVATMRAFFREAVEERLASGEDRADVLGGFLQALDEPPDGDDGAGGERARPAARARDLTEEEKRTLRDGLVNFFFTAHDVLTSSTAWCLWLLSSHPEIQAAARTDAGTRARAVRESLRLHPGYPLFSRRTQSEVVLGGFRVPSGTDVIVSPWVLHRLERHWPDAERFDPSRWDGPLEPVGPGPRGQGPRSAYMPFGGGFRSCIAFAVALPMIERIVERVIAEVELAARPGHVPDIVYWGSTSSANGLPVRAAEVARQVASRGPAALVS